MIVGQNTNKIIEYLRGKYKIEVFFKENVSDKQIASVVEELDRKSTRLNSSHKPISYAVFCLKKKKNNNTK